MLGFLIYDLKVAMLIIVFYMFYRLMLSRETFHRVNRVVLLLTAVASFVLPLCVITMHETVTIQAAPEVTVGDVQMAVAEEPATPLWQIALPILYIIGMLATLGHTLLSIRKVMLLIRQSEQHPESDGTIVCVIPTTSSSLTCSLPSSGSTLRCGCCAKTCAPFTNTRLTVRYSLKGLTRVNINIC